MAKVITYNAGTNTITAKGGTELDPITFTDLYNADQAGGWGVCDYKGEGVFFMDCMLQVGDGYTSTYFKDVKKVVVWTSAPGVGYINSIYIKSQVDFQLGEVSDVAKKQTYDACVFHVTRDNGVSRLFYGSGNNISRKIYGLTVVSENLYASAVWVFAYSDTVLWNCNFVNYAQPKISGDADLFNITVMGGSDVVKGKAMDGGVGSPTIDDFVAFNLRRVGDFYLTNQDVKVNNLKIRSNDHGIQPVTFNKEMTLLDCELDLWDFYMKGVGEEGKFLRKYTVNIHVTDKNGANLSGVNVVCQDKNDNEVFNVNTDAQGDIAEQEVTYQRWYKLATGWRGEGEADLYSPHSFIVSKDGYETLEIDAITLSEPVKWHLELQDEVVSGFVLAGQNLEGQLEPKINLSGNLQENVNMIGVLEKPDKLVGGLQKKTVMTGKLRKTDLVGEMK